MLEHQEWGFPEVLGVRVSVTNSLNDFSSIFSSAAD